MELGSISLYPTVTVKVGENTLTGRNWKPEPERAAGEFQGREKLSENSEVEPSE